MKADEMNLTAEELDNLCRLYMDCKLSVLEEKELEYILTRTSLNSPSIDEVKALMNIQLLPRLEGRKHKFQLPSWKTIAGIAASIAILLSVAIYSISHPDSNVAGSTVTDYIAAYSHGKRLSDAQALSSTSRAIARADSLMELASLTEREYIQRADIIINETLK